MSFNANLFNQPISQNNNVSNESEKSYNSDQLSSLKTSELEFSEDNVSNSGIGQAWNVTHWANFTESSSLTFSNDSSDFFELSQETGWNGYHLNSEISNLYDKRDWINGSFNYGDDDGDYTFTQNDTTWIENKYENWTFGKSGTNEMSGNYMDSGSVAGRESLELLMEGDGSPNSYTYYSGDYCWWGTEIEVPRGGVIDSEIHFDVNPHHLMNYGAHELAFSINGKEVYSYDSLRLNDFGSGWSSHSISQEYWDVKTGIYSPILNDTVIDFKILWKYNQPTVTYNGFDNGDYQQIFIDNVSLFLETEAQPEQVKLKLNSTYVKNETNWGDGIAFLNGNWENRQLKLNFTSDDVGNLSSFELSFSTSTILYLKKESPESLYETFPISVGTRFTSRNNSVVNWQTYIEISIPSGYEETNVTVDFSEDINISSIYDLNLPSQNLLEESNNKSKGFLNIPLSQITSTRIGYLELNAIAANYVNSMNIYNNNTGAWEEDYESLAGDHLNISAKINETILNSGYLTNTKANLKIRLPNGSIWIDEYTTVKDSSGNVQFDPIQIPEQPPNYQAGIYEAIITWNNSYNTFGLNQTGLIYSRFLVKHDSILEPSQGIYLYENVFEGNIKNIYIEFKDKVDKTAILDDYSSVYTYLGGEKTDMPMVSAGVYLLEFDSSKANPGNNTLTIYGESAFYLNKSIQIIVEVIKTSQNLKLFINGENRTLDPTYEIPIGKDLNFTIEYFDNQTGEKIENGTVTLEGEGLNNTLRYSNISKQYSLVINSKESLSLGVNFLNIIAQDPNFATEILRVKITVRRINLKISTSNEETQFNINPGSDFTINISLSDLDFNQSVENASLTYRWRYGEGDLTDEEGDGYYLARLTNVPQGTYTITISAFAGDDYEFEQLEITLVSSRAPAEFMLIQLIATIGIVSALGITGYLYAYQKVLRYPKPVRKVKKFKKSLSKDKDPDISVKSREDAFGRAYQKDLEESTKKSGLASKIKPKISGKAKQEKSLDEITKKATETKD